MINELLEGEIKECATEAESLSVRALSSSNLFLRAPGFARRGCLADRFLSSLLFISNSFYGCRLPPFIANF